MKQKPTRAWYLVAIFLPVLGGIIGYFATKNEDQGMANSLLIVSILIPIVLFILLVMALFFIGIFNPITYTPYIIYGWASLSSIS